MYVSTKRWTLKPSGPPSPLRHQKVNRYIEMHRACKGGITHATL